MKLLSFFTKLLHLLPTETSHDIGLYSIKFLHKFGLLKLISTTNKINESSQMHSRDSNITFLDRFPNKLGIAAGLDKNGDFIDALSSLNIGFIEIGTITPRPQDGNNKPRLFRDKKNLALINRMGFNNKGVDYLVSQVKRRKSKIPLGISIGKNFDTPIKDAYKDYLICLDKVYEFADYIAVNVSSPNTQNLRELSSEEYFDILLMQIKTLQLKKSNQYGYKPLFIKISPDETMEKIKKICTAISRNSIDGIICSNTSTDHQSEYGNGGISGKPLMKSSTEILKEVRSLMGDQFPIIASGGVMNVLDFQNKIKAGANLVQIYTGFIYKGPKLIKEILEV